MLSHFLRASKKTNIAYVGGYVEGFVGTTSDKTISLTSLTGGLASSPSAGDFVLVFFSTASVADNNLVVAGYTEITELYSNDSYDTNLVSAYKFMGSTPDTSFTLTGGTLASSDAGAIYVSVWRNINTTTPFQTPVQTATAANSVLANPPSITPTVAGSYIVACGAGAHTRGVATYSSSDLTGFQSANGNFTYDSTIGGGYKEWTSGAFDPAAFTFSLADNAAFSWAAITLALQPA